MQDNYLNLDFRAKARAIVGALSNIATCWQMSTSYILINGLLWEYPNFIYLRNSLYMYCIYRSNKLTLELCVQYNRQRPVSETRGRQPAAGPLPDDSGADHKYAERRRPVRHRVRLARHVQTSVRQSDGLSR